LSLAYRTRTGLHSPLRSETSALLGPWYCGCVSEVEALGEWRQRRRSV